MAICAADLAGKSNALSCKNYIQILRAQAAICGSATQEAALTTLRSISLGCPIVDVDDTQWIDLRPGAAANDARRSVVAHRHHQALSEAGGRSSGPFQAEVICSMQVLAPCPAFRRRRDGERMATRFDLLDGKVRWDKRLLISPSDCPVLPSCSAHTRDLQFRPQYLSVAYLKGRRSRRRF